MLCYHCMNEKGDAAVCPFCGAQDSQAPEPHHLYPGTVIGDRYTLGDVIGEGGFGITYIGKSNALGNTLAVKEYYPHGYCNRNATADNSVSVTEGDMKTVFENGRARFLKEAQTLARFNNEPGIVNVIDFVEENNTAYIVMEYLDGVNLRDYQKENDNFEPVQLVQMMMPMMKALEKVHAAGVIHRDISPDNIMMLRDGSLKLMDFGAARDFDGGNRSMSVMLKQGYAPEEQHRRNGEQGPWTDVYGICATIYRLITGVVPEESLDRVYNDTLKRPSEYGVKISRALEDALMYGMAVYKDNRCPDMGTLTSMMTQAIEGEDMTMFADQESFLPPEGNSFQNNSPNGPYGGGYQGGGYQNNGFQNNGGNYPPQPPQGYWTQQQGPMPPQNNKKSNAPIIVAICIVGAVIIAAAVVIILMLTNGDDNDNDTSSSSSVSSDVATTAPDADVEMPNLIGMSKQEAIDKLAGMNLSVKDFVETENGDQDPGDVFNQVPKKGSTVTEDTDITLYIAKAPTTKAPVSSQPKPDPDPDINYLYCTADTYVSLHSSASIGSSDIGKIWRGQAAKYISKSGDWYYVEFDGARGYAYASYLSASSTAVPYGNESEIYVDDDIDFLSLREGASAKSSEIVKIPPGSTLYFLNKCGDAGNEGSYHSQWIYVKYGSQYGYVYDYYVHD